MSWDATLAYPGEEFCAVVIDQNYTHNTNRMISVALISSGGAPAPECDGPLGAVIGPAWWKRLDGLSGADGAAYLRLIIDGLEAAPESFRAMNPDNGWGDFDGLLHVLTRMHDASHEHPAAVWSTSG